MTLDELKNKMEDFLNAIHEYKNSENFDSTYLEYCIIDPVLCRLPRDMVYVEWYDRSDIENKIDYGETITKDLIDTCMHNLWEYDDNIMDNELVASIVDDTVAEYNKNKGENND